MHVEQAEVSPECPLHPPTAVQPPAATALLKEQQCPTAALPPGTQSQPRSGSGPPAKVTRVPSEVFRPHCPVPCDQLGFFLLPEPFALVTVMRTLITVTTY